MRNWAQHFRRINGYDGADFGAEHGDRVIYCSHPRFAGLPVFGADTVTLGDVQARLNALGASPQLVVDGVWGHNTFSAVQAFQSAHGLSLDPESIGMRTVGAQTLAALGFGGYSLVSGPATGAKAGTPPKAAASPYKSNPNAGVNVATVVAALKQAAAEKGYTLTDQLASLMIGQLRGAEGAYPGVGGTLGGTNNFGAAQVTASLASAKKGLDGWGAFAHYDSDPNKGGYIGWYWIAPSALEGARYWLSNWWGNALLQGNPQNATDYATILYKGRYFGGLHAGDDAHDPTSSAGQANISDYASAISRGLPSANELSAPADDPSKESVNPAAFKTLSERKITQDLFNKAMGGGIGSAWKFLLPNAWDDLVKTNGVVWFGSAPFWQGVAVAGTGLLAGLAALGAVVIGFSFYQNHQKTGKWL